MFLDVVEAVGRVTTTAERDDHVGGAVRAAKGRDGVEQRLLTLWRDLRPLATVAAHAAFIEVDEGIGLGKDALHAALQLIRPWRLIDDRHGPVVGSEIDGERWIVRVRVRERERVPAQVAQVHGKRRACADLIDATAPQQRSEAPVLKESMQDEALRSEREDPAAFASELEQR